MKRTLTLTALAAALMTTAAGTARAQDGLDIVFAHHSSASNTFWQAVKKGFEDACAKTSANCQMLFTQTEGSIQEQIANLEAAIAQNPDAILTSIVDNTALDEVLQRARDAGITVLGVNVDDLEGAAGNPRQAFIGQGFLAAGHSLGQAQAANFPAEGPIKVLVGISAPGQNWSEQRGQGVVNFLEEYKASSGREITWEKIDSGTDLAVTAERVGAYLAANPDTTAYFDTGFLARCRGAGSGRPRDSAWAGPPWRLRSGPRGGRADAGRLCPGRGGPAALHAGLHAGDDGLSERDRRPCPRGRRHRPGHCDPRGCSRDHGTLRAGPALTRTEMPAGPGARQVFLMKGPGRP
jgi:simple sugar transport system substrate-binding protein